MRILKFLLRIVSLVFALLLSAFHLALTLAMNILFIFVMLMMKSC